MCGRYGYTNPDQEKIFKRFRLKRMSFKDVPRYNITPGQDVPVILNATPDELQLARWGLVPSWAKDAAIGNKMINARCETIFEKPSYRSPIKRKRCLILADCFYEWKKESDGKKQPYCIRLKSQEPFAFAGIWDCWKDELISCSVITTEPNSTVKDIHDRMPIILSSDGEKEWLKELDPAAIKATMNQVVDGSQLEVFKISKLVNSPSNDSKEILNS